MGSTSNACGTKTDKEERILVLNRQALFDTVAVLCCGTQEEEEEKRGA